ncbi:hypothetical protein SLU01_34690 [Sporosarcina luteola]|uniref:PepSY domain-containing protein n=1 Tax=Sporosarcina luteola TaxID=582850 RepID=A0A511ZCH5_9BACL|nr:hypothetical protein [Sporosarcina luteola]GEN85157.1 hypothetical protein SLU01_34690 [Sporosarcina luteola]
MVKIKKIAILFLFSLLLYGCYDSNATPPVESVEIINPWNDPVNITIEEANNIALRRAESEGYKSPALWKENSTKITAVYSVKYDRDVKVYEVNMSTEENHFGVFYWVSTDTGEIIISTE